MKETTGLQKNSISALSELGISTSKEIFHNLSASELVNHTLRIKEGKLASNGALCINTGKFTGRSPKDRYIVKDPITSDRIDWGKINQPIDARYFEGLKRKMVSYFSDKDIYVKEVQACADENYRLSVRLIAEKPWSAQFAHNMFLRPEEEDLKHFVADWTILCAPDFKADPSVDGTKASNFAILNFEEKLILIGGTGYTGEIKKGVFSVLNYLLPVRRNVLSMHCSSNIGKDGDTAIFFGLSGTGKTTLSTDPHRELIGDDEHGWSEEGVFNFEGGCYAKCIGLSEEKEPDIFRAVKEGAILENIGFKEDNITPDYDDDGITQNTRVSYPIYHIANAKKDSKGGIPKNIFFLTCDAFGVLPPISRLTKGQAMYHFISGYTAKVAGTEEGVIEPEATFSACFGAPFLPLHATAYAEMLGEKIEKNETKIWLVNTGWTGGPYGVGERIKLKYTRAMITAALNGSLNRVNYVKTEIFDLCIPTFCPGVPIDLLNAKNTWADMSQYFEKAQELAELFIANFTNFETYASPEIRAAAPKLLEMAV